PCDRRGAVDSFGASARPVHRAEQPLAGNRANDGDLACGGGGLVQQEVPAGPIAGRTPARGTQAAGVGRAGAWVLRARRGEPGERGVDQAPGGVAAEIAGSRRAAGAPSRGACPGREARLVDELDGYV